MSNRSTRNIITGTGETTASVNFSLCMAMLTQAHAIVEGKNTENLQSDDRERRLLPFSI